VKGYQAGSGNVFKDLGIPNAEEHLFKAQLVFKIDGIMKNRRLNTSVFEFCLSFCRSTVDSRGRLWTTVYRAQRTCGISSLFVACFGGVTGQRSN